MKVRFDFAYVYKVLCMAMGKEVTIASSVFAKLKTMSVHMKKNNSSHGVVGKTFECAVFEMQTIMGMDKKCFVHGYRHPKLPQWL